MYVMDIIDDLIYIDINGKIERIEKRELYRLIKNKLKLMKRREKIYYCLTLKRKIEDNSYLKKLNRYLDKILNKYCYKPELNEIKEIKIYDDYLHKAKVNNRWLLITSNYLIKIFEGKEDELIDILGIDNMINIIGNYI